MKKIILQLLVPAFAVALSTGCVELPDKNGNGGENPEFCNGVSCEEVDSAELTGVFVSGHLGNYTDCPGDGWSEEPVVGGSSDGAPPSESSGDIAEGACASDSECTPILNCEDAQATINLSNIGEAIATGIQVDRVELLNNDGDLVATLPVIAVTESGAAFDGKLADGDDVTLRVDFQGPQNPYSLLTTGGDNDGISRRDGTGAGTLRVVLTADDHDEVKVEGKEIYSVPSVDT